MNTTDWESKLYTTWLRACGKTATISKRNYHQILPLGDDQLSDGKGIFLYTTQQELFCLRYDELVSHELGGSKTLSKNEATRRCDYALFSRNKAFPQTIALIDLSYSADSSTKTLEEKKDKKSGLTKFEKMPLQILHSLRALKLSNEVKDYINVCPNRYAIASYRLAEGDKHSATKAFNRPVVGQTLESFLMAYRELNREGFDYYRLPSNYRFIIG